MKPIIRIQNPVWGIASIKIYEPKMHNQTMISFLVAVDGNFSTLLLNSNGNWDTMLLKFKEQEVIDLICNQIEVTFQDLNTGSSVYQ